MNKPGRRKVAAGSVNTKPRAVLDAEGYAKKQEVDAESSKTSSETVSVKTTTEEPAPTEPANNNIDAIDKVYAGYNQEEIDGISTYISRDKKLYSGEYLKDENFKNAEPAAYEKIKTATEVTQKFFNDFSEQTKALEKINREYDYLQFKNKKGVLTQADLDAYDQLTKSFETTYGNIDLDSLNAERDQIVTTLMNEVRDLLTTKENENNEKVGKSLTEINYMFDGDTYDLLDGSTYRSNLSLNEFDILEDVATSGVNARTAVDRYAAVDFLQSEVDLVSNDFVRKTIPSFKSILDKGLERLIKPQNEELDITNGRDMDIFIEGLFNFSIDSKKVNEIKNKIESAENLNQKNKIIYDNKNELVSLLTDMTPTQLQKLYESTGDRFYNKNFYFENDEQNNYFQNGVRIEIEDISQIKSVQSKIKDQAYVQLKSEYNNQNEAIKNEYLSAAYGEDVPAENLYLTGEKAVDITLKNFFANNLFDENTGQQRSLNELMTMFKTIHKEEIELAKEYFTNPDNNYERGGMFGDGSFQLTPEEIINSDFDDKTFGLFSQIELSKTKQRELKRLQKKYRKNNKLLDDVEYIQMLDDDGNVYYETEMLTKDDNGNIIDSRGGIPITNPKDVKEISKALEEESDIRQKIMVELHGSLTREAIKQKELEFDDMMLSNAINVFAASEVYEDHNFKGSYEQDQLDRIDELESEKELSWWDYAKAFIKTTAFSLELNPLKVAPEFAKDLAFRKSQKKLDIDPLINDVKRKTKAFLNIQADSDEEINSVRTLVYKAYSDLITDLDKQVSQVKTKTVFPNTLNYSDERTMNKNSRGAGINIRESYVPNYTDIDLNNPNTEKTKMLNDLISLTDVVNVTAIKGKVDYSGAKNKNNQETDQTINELNKALSKAKTNNEKVSLQFYPTIVDANTNAYQINVGGNSYTIYSNKEDMISAGEQLQVRSVENTDYNLLQFAGEWSFPDIKAKGFRDNSVSINKDGSMDWNYIDAFGEKQTEKIPDSFNRTTTIDQLKYYIQQKVID